MPSPRLLPVIALLALAAGAQAQDDGLAGSYLAGRLASMESDYGAAATYFARAMTADPGNAEILDSVIMANIGTGDFDKAIQTAHQMDKAGIKSGVSDLAILASLAKAGDYKAAIADLDAGRTTGPLVDGLFRAWSQLGQGDMSKASATFDETAKGPGLGPFASYHKALALALVGDYEGAEAIFSGESADQIRSTRRSVIAHAQVLSQLERDQDALKLIDATLGEDPADRTVTQLRADLKAGKSVPFSIVSSPSDGLAEVFYAVATALAANSRDARRDPGSIDILLMARTALYLRPDLTEAALLTAANLQETGQYDMAIKAYDMIGPDQPGYVTAALGRSDALAAAGRTDAAIEAIEQLTKLAPDQVEVWAALGDLLRTNDQFEKAAGAYDTAIKLAGKPARPHWILFYARAICEERLKNWARAEPDFRKALELSPGQPAVLNYLGYSYLEKRTNLDEALKMIEAAAKTKPDDGAIADSLGWAFYRLGRYPEAERQMEMAIRLMPVDATVNDHLGDVYWVVGRKQEAQFQWKRALSFKPESEADANRIRRKLEVGLDQVLQEEKDADKTEAADGG